MASEFFFSVTRITCAQIFRAAGIDRCSPSLLDAITDLFIRYLDLLATTASRNASLSGRNEVIIQDISMAMEETGLIKPIALLDPEDKSPNGIEGFELFINWAKGPIPEEARRVSGYTNIKKLHNNDSNNKENQAIDDDGNWLTALVKKRTRIDHEHKLKNTILSEESIEQTPVFTEIMGGPPELNLLSPGDEEVEERSKDEQMEGGFNEGEKVDEKGISNESENVNGADRPDDEEPQKANESERNDKPEANNETEAANDEEMMEEQTKEISTDTNE